MVVLQLCLLPILLVQAPAPQTPAQPRVTVATDTAMDPASWLPASTMFAATLQIGDDTDVPGLLRKIREWDPAGITNGFAANLGHAIEPFGLVPSDLLAIARGGVAFGVTGMTASQEPEFVCIAGIAQGSSNMRLSLRQACVDVLSEQGLYGGVFGDYIVIASTQLAADTAVAATKQARNAGLASNIDYTAACEATPLEAPPTMSLFARPAALFAAIAQVQPSAHIEAINRAGEALGIATMKRAMLRLRATPSAVETAGCWTLPPGQSLIGTLLGDPSAINPGLARAVPPGANKFSFMSTDYGAVMQGALDLIQTIEPGTATMVRAMMDQIGQEAEINIQRDVFGAFANGSVSFEVAAGGATMLALRDGAAFAATLDTLLDTANAPVEKTTVDGMTGYRFAGTQQMPLPITFATIGNWLCITHGEGTLGTIARQIESRAENQSAVSALRLARSGTTMVYSALDSGSHGAMRRIGDDALFAATFRIDAPGDGAVASSTAAAPNIQAPAIVTPAPIDQVQALQAAESNPDGITIAGLLKLAHAEHEGVAARATWLLAQREPDAIRSPLAKLAEESIHAEVRVLALHALLRVGNASALMTAIGRLDDKDMRVRTLAAQLLGKLRQPEAVGPLLAMLALRAKVANAASSSLDMQAALLALGDLAATEHMLPAASALDGSLVKGTGPALCYYFQSHSTTLPPKSEATLLVAVLGHSEPILRRYAIGRLGALRDMTTVKALEGRLATEGAELRPLIEMALAQVRRSRPESDDATGNPASDGSFVAAIGARWRKLSENERLAVGALAGLCLVLFVIISVLLGRQRRAKRIATTQSLVAPSAAYLATTAESQALADAADELIEGDPDDVAGEEGDWHPDNGEPEWSTVETSDDAELYDAPLDTTEDEPALTDGPGYRN